MSNMLTMAFLALVAIFFLSLLLLLLTWPPHSGKSLLHNYSKGWDEGPPWCIQEADKNPNYGKLNLNGMSFGKKIALHFYTWCRKAPIWWIRCLWDGLVSHWMQLTNIWNGEGRVSLKPKLNKKEWRNVGTKLQLGGCYSVPWDTW